jgi:hypothetical protein
MAEIGDVFQEFHKAKPGEKAVIIVGMLVVAAIAGYLYYKGQQNNANQVAPGASTGGGSSSNGSIFPSVSEGNGSLPVLPPGYSPITDSNGNIVGFQAPGTQSPTTTPPSQPATPANYYTSMIGKISYGTQINAGGIDQATGLQRFWYGNGPQSFFLAPAGTTFAPGAQGRIWLNLPGKPSNQQGILITGPGQ